MKEAVNHPDHYNQGIEVIEFIESWGMGFSDGNAVKYITRAPYKGRELEDLKKARWYLDRLIQQKEGVERTEKMITDLAKELIESAELKLIPQGAEDVVVSVDLLRDLQAAIAKQEGR